MSISSPRRSASALAVLALVAGLSCGGAGGPDGPPGLFRIEGGSQTGYAGWPLNTPVSVATYGNSGKAVAGARVNATAHGGGSVTPTTVVTNADGKATFEWTLGPTPGDQTLMIAVDGVGGQAVHATATRAPASRVAVTLDGTPTVGNSTTARAVVTDARGNALTDRNVAWTSSLPTVARVTAVGNGLTATVAGLASGTAIIRATVESVDATSSITVGLEPVSKVTVTPPIFSLDVGGTQVLTAVLQGASGNTLTGRTLTWSSADVSVATVSGAGIVNAVGAGTTSISATSEGVSAGALVTVARDKVRGVTITPSAFSLTTGASQQLTVSVIGGSGSVLTDRVCTWTVSPPGVVTVSPTGFVTAVGQGTATITASCEGVAATATGSVTNEPVAKVNVAPNAETITVGKGTQLFAALLGQSGATLTGRVIAWTTSDATIATVTSNGFVTGVAPGSVTITATSENVPGTATVTVSQDPVASVTVSPTSANVVTSGTQQFTATVRGASGAILTGRVVVWSSSNANVATVASSGVATGASAGTAAITATSEGISGSSTLTVSAEPVATVTISPGTFSLPVNATQQLGVALKGASGATLNGRVVTWTSTNASVATVSSSGLVTAVATGSATIRATSENVVGTAVATVPVDPVASVQLSPATNPITSGSTQQLTAVVKAASGATLPGQTVTWSSNNTNVATVSSSGLVTAILAGSATITATASGVNGTANVTVSAGPVATVGVTPSTVSINTAATTQLTATARDAAGNIVASAPIAWSSGTTSVATVNTSGLVTGVAAGTSTITASSSAKSGTSTVTVLSSSFTDDFQSGLSNWTNPTGEGSWTITNGTLLGQYDISCGSSDCPQADLLLINSRQLTGNWRAEVQTSAVGWNYGPGYNLTWASATFSIWASSTERLAVSAGYGVNNVPMPTTRTSVDYGLSTYPWATLGSGTVTVPTWTPSLWNTVALEKRGNTFTLLFNNTVLTTFTRTFSTPPKIGFHVYGRTLLDNFKLTALP